MNWFQQEGNMEIQESVYEDELLVKVPGSAYSLANHLDATITSGHLDEPSSNGNKISTPTVQNHPPRGA